MAPPKKAAISAEPARPRTPMGPKIPLALCLLCVCSILCAEAQRDNRRRSGRRKPTTESPPPVEEPEIENNPQKLDAETESIAKPALPLEAETNSPPASKDHANSSSGGPPFILPRGSRKPRPMVTRANGAPRPKPTLPTFSRKSQGRMSKPDRQDSNKKPEESGSSTSTTTQKPSRNSRRRSQTPEKSMPNAEKSGSEKSESPDMSTEVPKKRFGGRNRQQSRGGSRRISTAAPES